jgi:hypothetical protein
VKKEDQVFILGGLGVVAAIGYILWKQQPAAAGQADGGFDVESKVGARLVPYHARGGHYGAFGTMPTYWEPHRLVFPTTVCQNLQKLTNGGQALNQPAYGKNNAGWFIDPPAEAMMQPDYEAETW